MNAPSRFAMPLAATGGDVSLDRTHGLAIAITVLLSALDGYDVLSMSFAAPAILAAWGIGKVELGGVLSSGLVGMAIGSLVLAPLADTLGRKRMVLASLALMALGSFLSASAHGVVQLASWRVCTGLGIGACVAIITPLAAEFAAPRWRSFALSAMAMGYPAGGLAGGLLAAALLRGSGWPAIFIAGGIAAIVLALVVVALLPESPAFLAGRSRGDRIGTGGARGYARLFAAGQAGITMRLAAVNALTAAAIYYVLSWLPLLVADAGFAPAIGSMLSAVLSLIGIVGGLTLGAVARRWRPERLTTAALVGFAVAMAAFGAVPSSLVALTLAAGALGFLIFAASAGFYAVLAPAFDDASRASGSGFVIGMGRVSSAIAPLVAGWLFAAGLGRGLVSAAFAGGVLVAALILATYRARATA